jgi:uridylate kinase
MWCSWVRFFGFSSKSTKICEAIFVDSSLILGFTTSINGVRKADPRQQAKKWQNEKAILPFSFLLLRS